jgi:type II secretory pathway pseudopilin PulG
MTCPTTELHRTRRAAAPRAFSLVEMIVAIGIIVFLVGLTVSASVALVERAEIRKTEDTLRLLDMAMQEWELAMGRKLIQGNNKPNERFELNLRAPFVFLISEVLDTISKHPEARSIIAKIDPELVYVYEEGEVPPWITHQYEVDELPDYYGSMVVLDAWGKPIYPIPPGPLAAEFPDDFNVDPDGTIRLDRLAANYGDEDYKVGWWNEEYFGVARNRRVCFMSGGPDGAWGDLSADPDSVAYKQTLDNIYSYPIDGPSGSGY